MQAIIQVASKPPVSYQLLQIPMRRCDHANIHLLGTGAAQSFKLTLLEDPQQLRLYFEWNVPYFIEEHGALVCNLEAAHLARDGAGKCAPFMTKEFAFQQP